MAYQTAFTPMFDCPLQQMFRKEIHTNNLAKVSNKDKTKLKERLAKWLSQEAIEAIANSCKDIWTKKIEGSKGTVYFNGDIPILVDYTGYFDFFPTLHLLSQQPQMLPYVIVFKGVDEFIMQGTNLKWPGIKAKSFQQLPSGSLVSIATNQGIIIGVGSMKTVNMSQNTGIACTTLHFLGDAIWKQQTKGYKMPKMPKFVLIKQDDDDEKCKKIELKGQQQPLPQPEQCAADQLSAEQMSQLFQQCLLTTLQLNQPKNQTPTIQLPMDSGQFYSQWIKRACPQNTIMQIQHSTYKKLSTFYQEMQKKGYLQLRTRQSLQIVSLNYRHEILQQFKPRVGKMKQYDRQQPKQIQLFPLKLHNFQFIELFKLRSLPFLVQQCDYETLFDNQQVISLIRQYQDRYNGTNKGVMNINLKEQPELEVLLHEGQLAERVSKFKEDTKFEIIENIKIEDPYVLVWSRKQFERRCLAVAQPWTAAQSEDGTRKKPIKKHSKIIQIYTSIEKNKIVTWLCNLQEFIASKWVDQHLTDFGKYLGQRFSCGAAYTMHHGFAQIMVQGNFVKKLLKMLTEEYGLPEKNIEWREPSKK